MSNGMTFNRFAVWMILLFAWNLALYGGFLKLKQMQPTTQDAGVR